MQTSKASQIFSLAIAVTFLVTSMVVGYWNIGWAPVAIVGGSGVVALFCWIKTYLPEPLDPRIVLPPFLLTVAALEVHMIEEYLTRFAPAMSRVFDISWSERSFLIIFVFVGPALYFLTALGLFYRIPIAGFMAWVIFIGPGLAEFNHFIFPALQPAIQPDVAADVSQAVSNGQVIADMPNYYVHTTGRYYFSGMYTAILPMIPGMYGIYAMVRGARQLKKSRSS